MPNEHKQLLVERKELRDKLKKIPLESTMERLMLKAAIANITKKLMKNYTK